MTIKPSTPKGTKDFSSEDIAKRNYLKNILQSTFEEYGFNPIETPSFEKLRPLQEFMVRRETVGFQNFKFGKNKQGRF